MRSVVALLLAALLQGLPAYVREGNRVETEFHGYTDRLTRFFQNLRSNVERELSADDASALLRRLETPPSPALIYGYQMLPKIVDIPVSPTPIRTFSYSWPITQGYIQGEEARLDRAKADLARVAFVPAGQKFSVLSDLIDQYSELVRNQKTVDQYIEYNRFWQRSIVESRSRFDKMTQLYNLLKAGNPDTAGTIREALGKPDAPRFLRIRREGPNHIVLQVRVYTDITDDAYLTQVRAVIEGIWRTEADGMRYELEMELRKIAPTDLYRSRNVPRPGDHLDVDKHVARFPNDGGVITTAAEFTYGSVGRYVALGPGDLAPRTLGHEFGHILGFNDGYIRGYSDLGEKGFEILELTAFFDDIMSAPREGHVQPTHFKLLMEALK
jgi:hypothetical protein